MLADTQIANKQLEIITKELLEKLPKEIELMEAQVDKMVSDAAIAREKIAVAKKEIDLLMQQIALQEQKIITEKAQTQADIAEPGSVIDSNLKALDAQILGMERDAQQKVMNMMLSTWTTRKNNDAAKEDYQNLLTDDAIGAVIQRTLEANGYKLKTPTGQKGPLPIEEVP